jgi:hypothetical protein
MTSASSAASMLDSGASSAMPLPLRLSAERKFSG